MDGSHVKSGGVVDDADLRAAGCFFCGIDNRGFTPGEPRQAHCW